MSAAPIDSTLSTLTGRAETRPADLTEPFLLGEWLVEPALRRASSGTEIAKLDPRNLRVLQVLAERQGEIVSFRKIEELAWEGVVVTSDSLYQSIRQLRLSLRDTKSSPKYIETVPRRGYRLIAKVASPSQVTAPPNDPGPSRIEPAACETPASASDQSQASGVRAAKLSAWWRASFLLLCGAIASGAVWGGLSRLENQDKVVVSDALASRLMKRAGEAEPDAHVLTDLALFELRRGRPRQAIEHFEGALRAQLAMTGEQSEAVVRLLAEIANARLWLDEETAARDLANQAVSILDRLAIEAGPDRVQILAILGDVLVASGEYESADRVIAESIVLAGKSFGHGHVVSSDSFSVQAQLRHAQGNLPEAERIARNALEITIRARGAQQFQTAHSRRLLGGILNDQGKFAEAEREARLAVEILQRVVDERHPYMRSSMHLLGELLVRQGRHEEADKLLRSEIRVLAADGASGWRLARVESVLGESLLHRGKLAEAEQFLLQARRKLKRSTGWPIEREHRLLMLRLQQLATAQSGRPSRAKL